jgi:hypothetical protein
VWKPAVSDDYASKKEKTLVLERKFKLSEYTLIGEEDTGREFAVFSAVGFNRDRTRALLCWKGHTSGTCQSKVKKKGTWRRVILLGVARAVDGTD